MSEAEFAAALLNPDLAVPAGVVDPMGRPAPMRFAVYRNNVTQGLGKALEAGFPAVLALVGEAFFRAMALAFLRAHPPRGRIMMFYGAEFAGFIAGFEPARGLGYLADVARLEQALRESYHAADAEAVAVEALAALPETDLLAARLRLAPALRVLRSDWPVFGIYNASLRGAASPPMRGEDVLVTRAAFDPVMQVLPAGGAGFIEALLAGKVLAEALAGVPEGFDLAAILAMLIGAQAIVGVEA
jgi:hypothetical protein